MAEPSRIRLVDIAERCGVSKAAVSRALTRSVEASELRAETYEAILRTAREMGYRRPTRPEPGCGLVAAVSSGTVPPLFGVTGHIVAIAAHVLARSKRDLVLMRSDSPLWLEHVLAREPEGMLALHPAPAGIAAAWQRSGIPVVALDAAHDIAVPRVLVDDVSNGRLMTEHLLELGHRRIAYLGASHGDGDHASVGLRKQGWQQAMLAAQAEVIDLDQVGTDSYAKLASFLQRRKPPTAVVAYSDSEAMGVLQLAATLRISVPEQLSVIGCNAAGFPSWPPLTSMDLKPDLVGNLAADLLLRLMSSSGEQPTEPILVPGTFRPGASTGHPPTQTATWSKPSSKRARK